MQTNWGTYAKALALVPTRASASKAPTPYSLFLMARSQPTAAGKLPTPRCLQGPTREGDNTNRTHITIGSNNIAYPEDVGTPTGSIELVKLLINSVLSQRNAWLATMDFKNFYLNTPLDRPEYVCIKLADIPQEFIDKYKLNKLAHDS
jgi:hypothetical protein